jgi:cytochrome c553
MVDNKGRRRTASFPGAFAFMAFAITACGSTGPESSGAGSTVAATLHVCESCHGRDGRSISPTFPRLAGQQKNYIVEQLKAFRDKTRADPHARTYMWGLAAGLSDPTIDAIADYYSSHDPVVGEPGTSPEIAAGKTIYTDGIPSESVPTCEACHGEHAEGNGPIPRLAGQHQDYLARQLEAFASMERANEIMREISKNMTAEQISEVTAYLATL